MHVGKVFKGKRRYFGTMNLNVVHAETPQLCTSSRPLFLCVKVARRGSNCVSKCVGRRIRGNQIKDLADLRCTHRAPPHDAVRNRVSMSMPECRTPLGARGGVLVRHTACFAPFCPVSHKKRELFVKHSYVLLYEYKYTYLRWDKNSDSRNWV
jgi:hypothetical protein